MTLEKKICNLCVHKLTPQMIYQRDKIKKYKRGETFSTHYRYHHKSVNTLGRDLGEERDPRRHGHRWEYNIKYVLK